MKQQKLSFQVFTKEPTFYRQGSGTAHVHEPKFVTSFDSYDEAVAYITNHKNSYIKYCPTKYVNTVAHAHNEVHPFYKNYLSADSNPRGF